MLAGPPRSRSRRENYILDEIVIAAARCEPRALLDLEDRPPHTCTHVHTRQAVSEAEIIFES